MIGNQKSIETIRNWLKDFKTDNNCGGCFLTGATGSGKTTLVKEIADEMEYDLIRIVPSTMPAKKDIKSFIHNTLMSRDVVSCFTRKPTKKILMVDDIENIGPTQKLCLVEFLQWIYPSKKKHKKIIAIETGIPFIFVGRHTHIKAIQTALKHCIEVKLVSPTREEQLGFIVDILQKENLSLEDEFLIKLVDHCQDDIRQLRMMTNELIKNRMADNWSDESTSNFLNGYVQIHKENGLLEGTQEILNGNISFEESVILFDTDRYKIPLMIHQNYIQLDKNDPKKIKAMQKIIEILCVFDHIDSYMYKQQYWNLQYLCGTLICGGVSATVKNLIKDRSLIDKPIFTRHMNRVSLATVKRKNILTLQQNINIDSSTELYYIKNLLYPSPKSKPIQKWIDHYNLSDQACSILSNLFSN